jgi:hypothetical protein
MIAMIFPAKNFWIGVYMRNCGYVC